MPRAAISTQIRTGINAALNRVGLQLQTTRGDTQEAIRLSQLSQRGHWSGPKYTQGLRFEPRLYQQFLASISTNLRNFSACSSPATATATGFFLPNGWFNSVDAEVLYGLIRQKRPAQIIEVGSGFSTRLIRQAIIDGNLLTQLTSIDPMPRVDIGGLIDEQIQQPAETLEVAQIADRLRPNDFLFIDSSHRVVTGGDVTFLCLEVLPKLRPGVFIHFHDIFLPFDYPESWVRNFKWGWNELYLVHAFLFNNAGYDIVWPAHYMWRCHTAAVLSAIACDPDTTSPSGLWLKKLV